jgi:hypothetical protein
VASGPLGAREFCSKPLSQGAIWTEGFITRFPVGFRMCPLGNPEILWEMFISW